MINTSVQSDFLYPFRYRQLWQIIGSIIVVLIVVLSLIPAPSVGIELDQGDKYGHVLAYFAAMFWQLMLRARFKFNLFWGLGLFVLGGFLELAQGYLTDYRAMDEMDLLADGIGVLLAFLLAQTPMRTLLYRCDSHLP